MCVSEEGGGGGGCIKLAGVLGKFEYWRGCILIASLQRFTHVHYIMRVSAVGRHVLCILALCI